jgi:hypothetical protein
MLLLAIYSTSTPLTLLGDQMFEQVNANWEIDWRPKTFANYVAIYVIHLLTKDKNYCAHQCD